MRLLILFLLFPFHLFASESPEYGICAYVQFDYEEVVMTKEQCKSSISSKYDKHTIHASADVFSRLDDLGSVTFGENTQWSLKAYANYVRYVYGKPDGNTSNKLIVSWRWDSTVKPPCETPKTDEQCNKGKTATITGNDVFWATGNYKGCTFTAADGVFIKLADGSMTGDATSTGSTGKSWCETTDSSYNPADDEALSKNPAFSPAKDNDPKNCKNGWVQAGGGKFHCLNDTSGNVDAPPDKVNPEDGSINSDKDGKPKPPDAGVGKPPTGGTDPDGGGGTGPDGGGGDCEGEDCEGGGGGTKPPARPADPWADILDAADVARVKADTQSVQDELADFYRSAASGFQININKPAAGAMPSYGDITQGGQKISLSMSWLDKISFADGRAGVLVLCSLIAAYIILVRR